MPAAETLSTATGFSMRQIIALIALSLLTACEPRIQTVYLSQTLHRPPRPVLPRVKAQELECLAQPIYQRLYDRQRLIGDYAATLEAIIDSTGRVDE
jgi:hypothetical protein